MVRPSCRACPRVIRPGRRPVIALALAVVAVGGWLALPSSAAPVGSPATTATAPRTGRRSDPERRARLLGRATTAPQRDRPELALHPSRRRPADPSARLGTCRRRTPAEPAATPPCSIPHRGLTTATPLLKAALDARLQALRAKTGIPGISVAILFPDGTTWRGVAGLADVAAGAHGHPRHRLPGRQRLEDVHGRA